LFSEIEWVRDPDPVTDYIAQYDQVESNASAYVQAQRLRWPSLYSDGKKEPWPNLPDESKFKTWVSCANQLFCVIGSGTSWHDKGFPNAAVDTSLPDEAPPSMRVQERWYPFEEYSNIFQKKLNPSFARLAFRVLESIISFGITPSDYGQKRDVEGSRRRMQSAVQRYRELAQLHPDQADPDYVRWLAEEGRAEAWVAKFPLGPELTQRHLDNIASQKWVPEDTYAIEFDARKLSGGKFASKHGWSHQKDATHYAILKESGEGCWFSHAIETACPLHFIARVAGHEVSQRGDLLLKLEFDYGNAWMLSNARKAVEELRDKKAMKLLSKEKYEKLLLKFREVK
jgi:hypothetical protein